ncbi:MAG: lactate utilization protein [Chromatiaceae bacterium]|jgi:L-lactate dehydrogenase complex protein LldG
MSDARQRILARLRDNRPIADDPPPAYRKPLGWDKATRIAVFTERMQAVRGEVHHLTAADWVDWIAAELPGRGLHKALVGRSEVADRFAAQCATQYGHDKFTITRYERPIEYWKSSLFNDIDFALTGARAGLAESGSLVLWPDAAEPRLMSLVPPVHVAVLAADRLYENFADLLGQETWSAGMPTNALLVSGPSKTADIEQTLAFGIHGPKQLITLLID